MHQRDGMPPLVIYQEKPAVRNGQRNGKSSYILGISTSVHELWSWCYTHCIRIYLYTYSFCSIISKFLNKLHISTTWVNSNMMNICIPSYHSKPQFLDTSKFHIHINNIVHGSIAWIGLFWRYGCVSWRWKIGFSNDSFKNVALYVMKKPIILFCCWNPLKSNVFKLLFLD